MATTFDPDAFRVLFPEFSDTTKYPNILLTTYNDLATVFIATDGCPCTTLCGKAYDAAMNFMTAHLLSIGTQVTNSGADGGSTSSPGFETSATIGSVSVSTLSPPVKDAWDYWFYQSPYGQLLMALLKTLAVGGLSVGGLPERNAFRKVGGVFW